MLGHDGQVQTGHAHAIIPCKSSITSYTILYMLNPNSFIQSHWYRTACSVPDQDPHLDPDPYVFGPPGSHPDPLVTITDLDPAPVLNGLK
jgi:hypothetical protein